MTTNELENYEPKGDLIGFPKEIIARMLECQEEQGSPRDISVFERDRTAGQYVEGFARYKTKEGNRFWYEVINNKNFNLFFEKYPKQDNLKINNKMTTKELENYEPKGELIGFPKEIIARMLECQEEQGNKRDISVFEKNMTLGFTWDDTKEGGCFWYEVITKENFNPFFEKYPKEEYNQEFRVVDKVYDIILGKIGIVKKIIINNLSVVRIEVVFENYGTAFYTIEGKFLSSDKYPRLLHYRDDYDYSVIDFNNLPKRQEPKRWRAKVGEKYYYLDIYFEVHSFLEEYSNTDTEFYNSDNYFQTKEEAQELADMLKKCFQELINTKK